MKRLAMVLACLSLASACSSATQVIVLIDAEPGIAADADTLQVRVEGRSSRTGEGVLKLDEPYILAGDQRWPIRVALRPQSDDATRVFALETEARDGNTVIATARIVSSYVDGEVRYVRLLLEDACRGVSCDANPDETCQAGDCVVAYIEPGKLSKSETGALADDAGAADAGQDAGDAAMSMMDAGEDAASDAATDAGEDAAVDAGCGTPESCNGLDDDCDDNIDEELTRACGTDIGVCTTGQQICDAAQWSSCDGVMPGSEANTCDDIDSDCDGKTDEGLGCFRNNQLINLNDETDQLFDIVASAAGDLYATGYTCAGYSSESCDLWVGRFDATGVQSWVERYDNGFDGYQYFVPDDGRGIALDPQGNVVALGHMCNSGTEESCDLWLRKLTPSGDTVTGWDMNIDVNAGSMDKAADVVVAADGSVYIAATVSTAYGPTDTWIRKYDASGAVLWNETFDSLGSYQDGVTQLAVDSGGNLLVAGYTNDTQAWLRKYAPDRTVRWTRTISSPSAMNPYARASGVGVDSDDNVYLLGFYDAAAAITFLRKYDVDGNVIASRDIPVQESGQDGPSIAVDRDDNVIVALSFYGGSANGRDARVDKHDSDLTLLWSYTYNNGGADEYVNAVTTNVQGHVILGGSATPSATDYDLDTWIRIYGP